METIVNEIFRKRIECAAFNGSVIAKDILEELKRPIEEITDKTANYFNATKVTGESDGITTMRIKISYCNKDLANENFPDKDNQQAPYFPENRTSVAPSTFVGLFKNLKDKYSDEDLAYFDSAIRLNTFVRLRISNTMEDFYHAYLEYDYYNVVESSDCPLLHSCMRYEGKARSAADFYANFCNASILIAETADGDVLGRAVLWNGVKMTTFDKQDLGYTNLMDRMYFSYSFLVKYMRMFAASNGYDVCKRYNDYCSTLNFMVIGSFGALHEGDAFEANASIKLHASKTYKHGAPYLDTLHSLLYNVDGEFVLTNDESNECVASLRSSAGCADRESSICPSCGKLHGGIGYCSSCFESFFKKQLNTIFIRGAAAMHDGISYPAHMVNVADDGTTSMIDHYNNDQILENIFCY